MAVAVLSFRQNVEVEARHLVIVFEDAKKTLRLLKNFISIEVKAKQSNPTTLFRTNNATTKLLSMYASIVGVEYLYKTIGPQLKEVCAGSGSLQVVERKLGENDDIHANRWELMATVQKVFTAIVRSLSNCPM